MDHSPRKGAAANGLQTPDDSPRSQRRPMVGGSPRLLHWRERMNKHNTFKKAQAEIKGLAENLKRKRQLMKSTWLWAMSRWLDRIITAPNSPVDQSSIYTSIWWSSVSAHISVDDLDGFKEPRLVDLLEQIQNMGMNEPRMKSEDNAELMSREYRFTWESDRDFESDDYCELIEFQVTVTAKLKDSPRDCHIEVESEYEELVKRVKRKIVCD
jgi:hypothetical protein